MWTTTEFVMTLHKLFNSHVAEVIRHSCSRLRNALHTDLQCQSTNSISTLIMNTVRRTISSLPRVRRARLSSSLSCPTNSNGHAPSFPCVDAHAAREARIQANSQTSSRLATPSSSGPEPPYARPNPQSYNVYHHDFALPLIYADPLPAFDIAYETWGTLSPNKDNVILLHTGLSASSHAASTPSNPTEGWWQNFIGPGRALDTNQFFIICTNVLGGCYGSTGPSSSNPTTNEHYATNFPVLSIFDMVRAQFTLLDHLGIKDLYASVGSSMGAMQSLAAGWLFPERVGKVVSISGTARSSPGAIAMRFAQRSGMFPICCELSRYLRNFSIDGRSKLEQRVLLRWAASTYRHETG